MTTQHSAKSIKAQHSRRGHREQQRTQRAAETGDRRGQHSSGRQQPESRGAALAGPVTVVEGDLENRGEFPG